MIILDTGLYVLWSGGKLTPADILLFVTIVSEETISKRLIHFQKPANYIIDKEQRILIRPVDFELPALEQKVLDREHVLILVKLSDELIPLLELLLSSVEGISLLGCIPLHQVVELAVVYTRFLVLGHFKLL